MANLTNSAGCDSIASLVLTIKAPSTSITNTSICKGESFTFNGTTYTNSGTYTTNLINAAGCDSISSLVLAFKSPTTSIVSATICVGNSYKFNGKSYDSTGNYSFHLINKEGCDSIANLELIVEKTAKVDSIIGVSIICKNETSILSDNTSNGRWSSLSPNLLSIDSLGVLLGIDCGIGLIKYAILHSCGSVSTTKSITISGLIPTNISTIITASNCINPYSGSVAISISGSESPYQFVLNDSLYLAPILVQNLINGAYPIRTFNNNNCLIDSNLIIKIPMKIDANCDTLYVPSGFMPNSQNVFSRQLRPFGNGNAITNYSLKVYNRYGNVVFQTHDFNSGWDGQINGNQQVTGTYVWILEYTQSSGLKRLQHGTSVLVR